MCQITQQKLPQTWKNHLMQVSVYTSECADTSEKLTGFIFSQKQQASPKRDELADQNAAFPF